MQAECQCGVVSHNIWTSVTAWLSTLTMRLRGFAPSISSLMHTKTRSLTSHGIHFFSSLFNCKCEVFLILPLCSFLSGSSLSQASEPTQQITNWCLAWEAALCLPLAAWVKSLLFALVSITDADGRAGAVHWWWHTGVPGFESEKQIKKKKKQLAQVS